MTDIVDFRAQVTCDCCGNAYPEEKLDRLRRHANVAVCDGCIEGLARRRHAARVMPVLATADLSASKAFWGRAGFEIETYSDDFAFAIWNAVELHLVEAHPPARDRGVAYLHVRNVESLYAAWSSAGLPVSELREEPWGMREFNVIDPGGNRVRVGQNR